MHSRWKLNSDFDRFIVWKSADFELGQIVTFRMALE